MIKNRLTNKKLLFAAIWFALWFVSACVYICIFSRYYLDADMSSELLLSKLLSDEGGILSKNWFYSTELRVLNTQLVFAPLFKIFSSWHTVRSIGSIILLAIYAMSYFYFARSIELNRERTLLTAGMLFMPLSVSYSYIMLTGMYYIPHVSISFILFGLSVRYIKKNEKKRRLILLLLTAILALIAGLGGIRQIFIFTLPIFVASIAMLAFTYGCESPETGASRQNSRRFFAASTVGFAASGIGYVVNSKILSKIYTFWVFSDSASARGEELSFSTDFGYFSFDGLASYIHAMFEVIGYKQGPITSIFVLFSNVTCAVTFLFVIVALVICIRKLFAYNSSDFITVAIGAFYAVGLVILAALYGFTDMECDIRYCIPIFIFIVPLAAKCIPNFDKQNICLKLLILCMTAFLTLDSASNYRNSFINYTAADTNSEYVTIADYLEEKGYTQGCASFWNANILTELSDGEIEVWNVGMDHISTKSDLGVMYEWLQVKSHAYAFPEDKLFLVLNEAETRDCNLPIEPDFSVNGYSVYLFDSFNEYEKLYS